MHLWLAHTRHPCKCKHPLSTFKSIWLYMHKGQPDALRILCLRIQCSIVSSLLRITFKCTFYQNSEKSLILYQQTTKCIGISLNDAFKLITYLDISYASYKLKSIVKGYTDVLCLWQTCQAMD